MVCPELFETDVTNLFIMFFHRTCDCSGISKCNQGQRCHKYDDVKCGNGICKYLFGNDWGLVFNFHTKEIIDLKSVYMEIY